MEKSLQDGEEEKLIDHSVGYRNWSMIEDGIYYAYQIGTDFRLEFYSFKTKNVTEICKLEGLDLLWGICVSPDRHYLIFSKQGQIQSDITIWENFR